MAGESDKNNPWAICRASVGDDRDRLEACVLDYKKKHGMPIEMTEASWLEKAKVASFGELRDVEIATTGIFGGDEITEGDLENVKRNFDEFGKATIQPPLVPGHDESHPFLKNSGLPAFGWTKSVETRRRPDGRMSLFATIDHVPEMVRKAVERKLYKRISPAFYVNYHHEGKPRGMTLRHIGLLGAEIPEMKTLADVLAYIEPPSGELVFLGMEGESPMNTPVQTVKLEDLTKIQEAMKQLQDQNAQIVTQLTESRNSIKTLQDENVSLKKKNDELVQANARGEIEKRRASVEAFCETMKRDGRLLPAWEEAGIRKFMETLDDASVIKFSEKSGDETPLSFMKRLLSSMPNVVKFEELAKANPDILSAQGAGRSSPGVKNEKLNAAAKQYQEEMAKANKMVTFGEAVRFVSKKNPNLVEA